MGRRRRGHERARRRLLRGRLSDGESGSADPGADGDDGRRELCSAHGLFLIFGRAAWAGLFPLGFEVAHASWGVKSRRRSLWRPVSSCPEGLAARPEAGRFGEEPNADPKPFVWTANPDRVLAAIGREQQALESTQ